MCVTRKRSPSRKKRFLTRLSREMKVIDMERRFLAKINACDVGLVWAPLANKPKIEFDWTASEALGYHCMIVLRR